jgi:ubiquinone/menaquinone biosynthesis C-methylase UbiE
MKNLMWVVVTVAIALLTAVPAPAQDKQATYERERDADEVKREAVYREELVLDIAQVKPGMVIGEVGAGDGYFTMKLARRVGPGGKVYANDILDEWGIGQIRRRAQQSGLANIQTVLGTESDPRLPAAMLDMVFLVRVLHDLNKPVEMLETLAASLKPGGKIVIVELEKAVRNEIDLHHSMIRQDFMDVFAKTSYALDRIDKSLPDPRSVVFILSRKQTTKPPETGTAQDRQLDACYQVDKALDLVGMKPGMTVGQVGTENGYLVLKLAERVGPTGRVLASGTDEAMLKRARDRAAAGKLTPVEPVVERYVFEKSGFKVERIDTTTTPDRTIFVLSPVRGEGK